MERYGEWDWLSAAHSEFFECLNALRDLFVVRRLCKRRMIANVEVKAM
jgi:hypothetical protein